MRATKGKAVRTESTKSFGRKRAESFVIFEVEVQRYVDGEVVTVTEEKRVRSRDVIDFWEDYERERAYLLKERERAEEEARQERERQQREYEERRLQQQREREEFLRKQQERKDLLVSRFLERTGIPESALTTVGATTISLDRQTMELWLSVDGNGDNQT